MEPKTRKGQATKNKMIEVAAKLILKNGVTATTVNDVLQMSNTGKSQFSHYFGSKEQLIFDVIEFHKRTAVESYEEEVRKIESLDDLPAFCELLMDQCKECIDLYKAGCPIGQIAQEIPGSHEAIQSHLSDLFDYLNRTIANRFRELQSQGKIKTEADVEELASFINCIIQGGKLWSKTTRQPQVLGNCLKHMSSYLSSYSKQNNLEAV